MCLLIDVGKTYAQHEILLVGGNGFLGKVILGLLLDRFPNLKQIHLLLRAGGNLTSRERFQVQVLQSPALVPVVEKHGLEWIERKVAVWPGDIVQTSCGLSSKNLKKLAGRVDLIINCAALVDFFPPLDDSFRSNVDGVENLILLAKQFSSKLLHVSTCYVCGEANGLIEETEPIRGFYPRKEGPEDKTFDHTQELRTCRERIDQIRESDQANDGAGNGKNSPTVRLTVEGPAEEVAARVRTLAGVHEVEQKGQFDGTVLLEVRSEKGRDLRQELAKTIVEAGWGLLELNLAGMSLEVKTQRSKETAERLVEFGRRRAGHWGWVNTYTFSKSIGEQILASEKELEHTIVRPAIIESALRFPFPGWIEGGRTSASLVLMALSGMRDWPVRADAPLEVVPVDLVASAILVVGALLIEGRHQPVYQLGSADINPIHLGPLIKFLESESRARLRESAVGPWKKTLSLPPQKIRFLTEDEARVRRERSQKRIGWAQAVVARMGKIKMLGGEKLSGWNSALRIRELQTRFRQHTLDQYLPFVLHNRYLFESENIRAAYAQLSEKDRALLPWDPEKIDWKNYWLQHQVKGIEKWIQPDAVKEWSFKI